MIQRKAEVFILHKGVELGVRAFKIHEEPVIDRGFIAERDVFAPFRILLVIFHLIAGQGSAGQLAALEHLHRRRAVRDLL